MSNVYIFKCTDGTYKVGKADNPTLRKLQVDRFYEVESDSIYLTKFEIQKMATVELDPSLDKVRDLFIIACHTGLRFSDFSVLTKENIVEQESSKGRVFKAFKVKTQKTGALVQIPISKEVERILEKYNGIPPKAISNQKMNTMLKIIAEKAGLTDDITKSEVRGGEKVKTSLKKFQLVTCGVLFFLFLIEANACVYDVAVL